MPPRLVAVLWCLWCMLYGPHKNWNLCQWELFTCLPLSLASAHASHGTRCAIKAEDIEDAEIRGAARAKEGRKEGRRQQFSNYYLRGGKLFLIHHTYTVAVWHLKNEKMKRPGERERERHMCRWFDRWHLVTIRSDRRYLRSHATRYSREWFYINILGIYVSHLLLICFRRQFIKQHEVFRSDAFFMAHLLRMVSSPGIRCLMGSLKISILSNPEHKIYFVDGWRWRTYSSLTQNSTMKWKIQFVSIVRHW